MKQNKTLKIKDNIDLKKLKVFGFKLEPNASYYYIVQNDVEIFIWNSNNDEFYEKNVIYFQIAEHMLVSLLPPVIYELIKADMVEIV